MDRNTDGQDGTYAEGTTKWPAEENRPQGKPSTKKSQSNKGKNIIRRAYFILKTIFSLPAPQAEAKLLYLMSVSSWSNSRDSIGQARARP